MTTDTPPTDAIEFRHCGNNLVKCYCPRCIVGVHDNIKLAAQYRVNAEWRERAEKAEAEVERLKANLRRSIKIADVLSSGGSRACRELYHSKLDQHEYGAVCPVEERLEKAKSELRQLKAITNQDNK